VKLTAGIDFFQDLALTACVSPVDRLLAIVAVAVVDGAAVVDCVPEEDDSLPPADSLTRGDLREVFAA
jgi:ribonuclease PH